MLVCAQRGQLVHHTTFRCYDSNTQGPCNQGEVFVANSEDEVILLLWLFCKLTILFYQCLTPHCVPHNACEEDQLLYQDVCWDKTNFSVPCQVKNPIIYSLF